MKMQQQFSFRNTCGRGLLAVVLLLAFFICSGRCFSQQTRQAPTQTTWVIRNDIREVNGLKYRQLSKGAYKQQTNFSLSGVLRLSRTHSKWIVNVLKFCSGITIPQPTPSVSRQHKTIPQNGKDDPASNLG